MTIRYFTRAVSVRRYMSTKLSCGLVRPEVSWAKDQFMQLHHWHHRCANLPVHDTAATTCHWEEMSVTFV